MPSLGNVVSVGRFVMGKVGLFKSVKGGGFATLQASVTGLLLAQGFDGATATLLGGAVSAGVNVAWQWVRKYEVVEKDVG